jgi:hypothetical protein
LSKISVYVSGSNSANIEQISVKRDWMDETDRSHAYRCFPVSLSNTLGWGLSFNKDITFIWDGISDTTPNHVKILEGEEFCFTGRANATISFNTGLRFKTDEDVTILQMPVPNQFIDGVQAFTTLMSTSFYPHDLPCAWKITKANVPITIKAGTPIISIIPISLGSIKEFEVDLYNYVYDEDYHKKSKAYGDASQEITMRGEWTDFYRDAVDEKNNSVGSHETKSLRLKVNDLRGFK